MIENRGTQLVKEYQESGLGQWTIVNKVDRKNRKIK